MTIFNEAISTLKSKLAQSTLERVAFPRALLFLLTQFKTDEHNPQLELSIVDMFFTIKHNNLYYRHIAHHLPCLKAFKSALGKAINHHIGELSYQDTEETIEAGSPLNQNEMLICSYYYLLKTKLYTQQNKVCCENHHQLDAVVKSMRLLYRHKLLTQTHFHFIATPHNQTDKTRDLSALLFSLECKDWLNERNMEKVMTRYKIGHGKILLMLTVAESGGDRDMVRLLEFSEAIFNKILSLSSEHLQKLEEEFTMLSQFSKEIVIDHALLDVMIDCIQHEKFQSHGTLLRFFSKKNVLDTTLLFTTYHYPNYKFERIVNTLQKIITLTPTPQRAEMIQYYFKNGAADLTEYFEKYENNRAWIVPILIPTQNRNIITAIDKRHPHLLTERFVYQLKSDSFIAVTTWFLENAHNLPTQHMDDWDLIKLGQCSSAKHIMQLLSTLPKPSFHLFHLLVEKAPQKYREELLSIVPILTQSKLMHENVLQEIYLKQKHNPTEGISYIILIIRTLGHLDRDILGKLIRQKNMISSAKFAEKISALPNSFEKIQQIERLQACIINEKTPPLEKREGSTPTLRIR